VREAAAAEVRVKAEASVIAAFYVADAELDEAALAGIWPNGSRATNAPGSSARARASARGERKTPAPRLRDELRGPPWSGLTSSRTRSARGATSARRTSTARSSAHPDHPFEIEWHPFQLNPDMPAGGMDRRAYLEAKFGGRENAARIYARVDEAARRRGSRSTGRASRVTPNTLDAHRLIHWAGLEGRQTPVVAALFRAYWREGRDIGAGRCFSTSRQARGSTGRWSQRLLESDADAEDIRARDAHARARGVTGVPTFVVANRHVVPGAQPPELWEQVIDEIVAQTGRRRMTDARTAGRPDGSARSSSSR
jgi:predicted DsbA family dithiol-disulfide isomerase